MTPDRPLECPSCGFSGGTDLRFCGRCGTPMARVCGRCGFANEPEFRFCGGCGSSLEMPEEEEAERRQLTVMFCDLVRAYQAVCTGVCRRYGGHVAQYLGDGILVYFGYPAAHEDDPRRAVRAGLELVEALAEGVGGEGAAGEAKLTARVGIHTGLVVLGKVGAGERHERLALGEVPNLAARLQALATPNSVVVSGDTYRRLAGWFVFEALGARPIKGLSRPVELFRAVADRGREGHLELDIGGEAEPLVDRRGELRQLEKAFSRVSAGQGHALLVVGEAGIGKSRLLRAASRQPVAAGPLWLVARCSAFLQGSAFAPVIRLLEGAFGLTAEGAVEERRRTTVEALKDLGLPLQEAVPLLGAFLGLPPAEEHPLPPGSPQRHRERTLELVVGSLCALAAQRALVVAVEDLHWADASTLEVVERLLGAVARVPLLALLTARPSFQAPSWPKGTVATLPLGALPSADAEELVASWTGGRALPAELTAEIVDRAGGVPLYLEEVTKMMLESGVLQEVDGALEVTGDRRALEVPATLRDSLMARLDQLGEVKAVAQLASVFGRELGWKELAAVSSLDEPALRRSVERLVEAEVLLRRGKPPRERYVFKHALLQEAAYSSLLRKTRRRHHGHIAAVLEERFPRVGAERPEVLAHHFGRAGQLEEAVDYRHRAGQQALARYANREAVQHLEEALRLLARLEPTAEHRQRELVVLSTLGPAVSAIHGFAAPEVEATYSRAFALCQELGDVPELFWVTWGLWAFLIMRAHLDRALELAERLTRLAEEHGGGGLLLEARFAEGSTRFFLGEPRAAKKALEEALALDTAERDRSAALVTGQDAGVVTRSYLALVVWLLGEEARACALSEEAVALARRIGHPFSLSNALLSAACLHQLRRRGEPVGEHADEAAALAAELGFFTVHQAHLLGGWSDAAASSEVAGRDRAAARMERALGEIRASGARVSQSHAMGLLVEAHLAAGRLDDARSVLDEALALVEETGERFWEAELERLAGELALRRDPEPSGAGAEAARRHFERALEVARHQGAAILALRAAVSLGCLLAAAGERGRARELVAGARAGVPGDGVSEDHRRAGDVLAAWSGERS